MSAAPLSQLAGMFGTEPFTAREALRQLDAGRVTPDYRDPTRLLSFGAQLREAVGRPVVYGARTVALRRLGVTNSGARRWRFEIAAPASIQPAERGPTVDPAVDPDMDIL